MAHLIAYSLLCFLFKYLLFVFEHFAWFPGVKCLLASGHVLDQNEQKWDLEGVMRQVVAGTTTIEEDQLGMGISWEMLTRVYLDWFQQCQSKSSNHNSHTSSQHQV